MGLFKFLKEKIKGKSAVQKDKYVAGLDKSRKNFSSKLKSLSKRYTKITDEYFEELEQILIEADVGINLTLEIVAATKVEAAASSITDPSEINEILVDKMFVSYANQGDDIDNEIHFQEQGPTVLLVIGVNGVGKTTTIAKLAKRYLNQKKKILLVAGDTFRAGATEQLTVWADRLGIDIVTGSEQKDPSSVAYDGMKKALDDKVDLVILDTAGRLQNKVNLMAELSKMKKVVSKVIPDAPHETFLIIDATTGQNGVLQAKAFKECTDVTGVVITKMDGTSKGGIILAIRDELGIPVRFIGLGERMEDLEEFDLDQYLYGLCLDQEETV